MLEPVIRMQRLLYKLQNKHPLYFVKLNLLLVLLYELYNSIMIAIGVYDCYSSVLSITTVSSIFMLLQSFTKLGIYYFSWFFRVGVLISFAPSITRHLWRTDILTEPEVAYIGIALSLVAIIFFFLGIITTKANAKRAINKTS